MPFHWFTIGLIDDGRDDIIRQQWVIQYIFAITLASHHFYWYSVSILSATHRTQYLFAIVGKCYAYAQSTDIFTYIRHEPAMLDEMMIDACWKAWYLRYCQYFISLKKMLVCVQPRQCTFSRTEAAAVTRAKPIFPVAENEFIMPSSG